MKNINFVDFNAGMTLFILIIYFMFFTIMVNAVNNFDLSINSNLTEDDIISGINVNKYQSFEYCSTPRYRYDTQTLATSEFKALGLNTLKCEESFGIKSLNDCQSIEGCAWEEIRNSTTQGFWAWMFGRNDVSDVYYSCVGDINATAYGINTSYPIGAFGYGVGRPIMSGHNNTNNWIPKGEIYTVPFVSSFHFSSNNICAHPLVIENESNCALFSCSWVTFTPDTSVGVGAIGELMSTIGSLFTLHSPFNFENENINLLLYVIFFLLPLILLIICLYLMIPFI